MKILIALLLLLLCCSFSNCERNGEYYSRYNGRNKEGSFQPSAMPTSSNNNLAFLALFNKANQVIGYCTLVVYVYRWGKRILKLDVKPLSEESKTTFVKVEEDEAVQQIKTENEEIWNAILNIHNTQSEIKDEIQRLDKSISVNVEGEDPLSVLKTAFDENIDNIAADIAKLRIRIENLESNSIEIARDIASIADISRPSETTFAEVDARRMIDENNKLLLKKLSLLKDELLQTILKIKKKP